MSKSHPFAVAIVGLLLGASLVCAGLVGARMLYSESSHYWFLTWNLLLAWVPLVFAGLAYLSHSGRRAGLPLFTVLAAVVWLLFFPNAPYILTDFLHLGSMGDTVPGWYDVLMLFWFAWAGLMLGVVSLHLMHEIVRQAGGRTIGWAFVVTAAALGSFWDLPRPIPALE